MSTKQQYGQFYTTNSDYILTNIKCDLFEKYEIIEPFVGGGDIIKWLYKNKRTEDIKVYDIEPSEKVKEIIPDIKLDNVKKNTLLNPPDYNNKVVITNPPYLARNKSKNTNNCEIFDKCKDSDLFRIHIRQLIEGDCYGGILIIPINFFSSIKKSDVKLRDMFLTRYKIIQLNIFKERVFEDTSYTICSFSFVKNKTVMIEQNINITFYPDNNNKICLFKQNEDWLFGGKIYKKRKNNYKIERLTKTTKTDNYLLTNIKLYALDGTSKDNRIRLEYDTEHFYGKITDRCFATIMIKKPVDEKIFSITNQKKIIELFNNILNDYREKYDSLFLTNYRESKNGIQRKRISFKLAYKILDECVDKL
jgi:hypothetical protein